MFIITLVDGVFDLQFDKRKNTKCINATEHIVKIFNMGILCMTLKERNLKRFMQKYHSPNSPSSEWS